MRFARYELRTTDVDAARAFYAEVLGAGAAVEIAPLPERARARGAPAHWLGHVAVPDVAAAVEAWVGRGGQLLGPVGEGRAILRDAQGAVAAVTEGAAAAGAGVVRWHELHTTDAEAAWAAYSAMFGWRETEVRQLAGRVGRYRMFAWEEGGPSVGAMASTAGADAAIHTHWLFYLEVADLDAALARVRARGGVVVGPGGPGTAVCEDAQGAAFGLI